MAQKTLTTRIVLRNDVQANWTANNPILLKGEIGLETDTHRYKIGDGVNTWDKLKFYSNLDSDDAYSLSILIGMLNDDDFGNVADVKVNDSSVVTDKVANISIGTLTFTPDKQSMNSNGESFTGNITLHKVAKTGSYNDLVDKLNVIDSLDSTSTTEPVSANQAHLLKQMVQALPTATSYPTIQEMISSLNSYNNTELNVGANLYLQQLGVPDFWVYSKEATSVPYTYTDDSAFISAVQSAGSVQVGYYKVSLLETAKVDLTNYYTKTQIDGLLKTINDTITGISDRVTAIETDATILRSNDSFILDGGNSEV